MELRTFNNEADFIAANLEFLEGAETIALSGGSTPVSTYEAMKNFQADFYQVDERYVAPTDENSNQKMIAAAIGKDFHHFDTSLSIEEALNKYEQEITKTNFDVCILGIGPDGHTASLFPGSPALNETRAVAHTQTEEFNIKDRLTITFPKILASKKLLVLLKDKQEILAKLQGGAAIPAQRLLQHPSLQVHHLQTH